MYEQMTLFQPPEPPPRAVYGSGTGQAPYRPGRKDSAHMESVYLDRLLPFEEYDRIIVAFSGGKDSLAAVLDLLERGVPRRKIELWHHDVDGGHPTRRMDWPVTRNYVQAVADYLGITLRVSWRVTLDNRLPLAEYVGDAESCVRHDDPRALRQSVSGEFTVSDVERTDWALPAGAFHGAAGGPC